MAVDRDRSLQTEEQTYSEGKQTACHQGPQCPKRVSHQSQSLGTISGIIINSAHRSQAMKQRTHLGSDSCSRRQFPSYDTK